MREEVIADKIEKGEMSPQEADQSLVLGQYFPDVTKNSPRIRYGIRFGPGYITKKKAKSIERKQESEREGSLDRSALRMAGQKSLARQYSNKMSRSVEKVQASRKLSQKLKQFNLNRTQDQASSS